MAADPGDPASRRARALEFVLVFLALPTSLIFLRREFAPWLIPFLVVTSIGCFVVLRRDPTFDRRRLWNAADWRRGLRPILTVFVPGAAALALVTATFLPRSFLSFPRSSPLRWAIVLALYPVLSVYPQELIFRTFLFHRYRAVFRTPAARVAASALAFGLAHAFLANWIAPTLSLVGGWLFARTYARSDSTLQSCLDHALWGDFLFTVGLGWYFYTGSIG